MRLIFVQLKTTNLLFAGLKDIPIVQEERLHLIDASRGNENKVENSEKPQLERESTIFNIPKSKTAEERCEDVKVDLIPHVILENISEHALSLTGKIGKRTGERQI